MTTNRPPEHHDSDLYARYHIDVYAPPDVWRMAMLFLPRAGEDLPLSKHYRQIMHERGLPLLLHMPLQYDIIEVTLVRVAEVLFRVLIRWPFDEKQDIAAVLEGDHEVVTAYWISPDDDHPTLYTSVYEQPPDITVGVEEARRQSRPDDIT